MWMDAQTRLPAERRRNNKEIFSVCCVAPEGKYLFEIAKKRAAVERFTGCNDHAVQADEKKPLKQID